MVLQHHWLKGFGHSCRKRSFHPGLATVFLLVSKSIGTTRMDPQGSYIGVRMNNNNNQSINA